MAVAMTATLGAQAPQAAAAKAVGKRPAVQVEKPVAGTSYVPKAAVHLGALPTAAKATAASNPASNLVSGSATVALPAGGGTVQAGSLPVRVGAAAGSAATGSQVTVAVADGQTAQAAGVNGLMISLTPASGAGGAVSLDVDTAAIAGRFGGDYASRLHLVKLPSCALTTPQIAACRVQTPMTGTSARVAAHTLTSTVALAAATQSPVSSRAAGTTAMTGSATAAPATMVLAATGSASGPTSNFTATTLSPSSQWSSGSESGDFTWSYAIDTPTPFAGAAPSVALSYDSGAVDGHTDSTNNQTSPIGEGFDLATGGFIERSYQTCSQFTDLPTAEQTGDDCWAGQILNMSLGGKSTALVWDPVTGDVHPADDNGERVQLLKNASNGAYNGEYWKITTTDGTQYFFGRNHGPGYTNQANTNSVWTVPVYGAHSGDPCYNATFTAASCNQAWRWNLDYVEDVHGNATMYYYTPETNYYLPDNGKNGTTTAAYTRGGVLDHIEYGLRDDNGTVYANPAVDKVTFTASERCIPNENNDGFNCDPSQFNATNAAHWHDVPFDQSCSSGATCSNYSPSFWSRKRVTAITTQVYNAGAYQNVDTYSLAQSYPDTGDGTPFALALASVQRCGTDGATCTPAVKFLGGMMPNRVPVAGQDSTYYPAINKWRLVEIDTETGEQIQAAYNTPACSPTNLPASDSTNSLDCFPEYWTPLGQPTPIKSYFYHYTVKQVTETDPTGGSPNKTTNYTYLGGAAWHFDDSELSKASQRTYSQFRGYAHVQTRAGANPVTLADTLYFRGMDGDILPSGKRSVTVSDTENDDTVADANALAGQVFESDVYTGDGGSIDHATVTDYTTTGPTATRPRTGLNSLQALMVLPTRARTRQMLASGAWRRTVANTAYNNLGMATQGDDESDGTRPTCTRTTYLSNTTTWLTVPSRVTVTGEVCPTGTQAGKLVSDTETSYDNQAYGTVPTVGNPTSVISASSSSDGTATGTLTWAPATTATFDSYGRPLVSTDPMGRQSAVAYTPSTLGPVTQTVKTTLASTDPLSRATTTVTDPLRGLTTASVDVAGLRTDATYDALGRLTQLWQPGRSKSGGQTPNSQFTYAVSTTGPSVVTAQRLLDDNSYSSTVTLYDALLRARQTQTDAEGGGRVITDSVYDSHGWMVKANSNYFATGVPTGTIYSVGDSAVPAQSITTFDGLGRVTKVAQYHYANYTWETDTVYGGDRTTSIPPAGGTSSTTVTDARGATTAAYQYTATPAVAGNTVTGPVNGSGTVYGYDFAGRTSLITDPSGKNTWTYGYDLRGRKTSQTDPDAGASTYTYDDDSEMLTSADARGTAGTVAYKYDNLGRKTGEYSGSATGPAIARWTYDSVMKGKPTASAGYANGLAYVSTITGYTSAGLPTGTKVTIPSGEGALYGNYTTSYGYTPNTNQVQSVTEPAAGPFAAETVTTAYTRLGHPVSTEGNNYYVSNTAYSPYGEPLQYTQGPSSNPVWQTLTYDDQTRQLTEDRIDQQAAPPQVDKVDYTYTAAGQVTQIADTRGSATDTQCFGYDGLGQLTQAWTATDNCAANPASAGNGTVGSGIAPYWTSWTFDTVGDRLTQVQHALPGATGGDTTTAYAYPAAGSAQPHTLTSTTVNNAPSPTTSYQYDPAGNTTTRATPANGSQTLNWDAVGHLTSVAGTGTTSYVYDANGAQLMRKDPGKNTLYLGDTELYLNTSTGAVTGTRYYKQGGATVAALDSTTGHVTYQMPDRQGTADVSLDSTTGNATFRNYTPYGDIRGAAPASWPGQKGYLGVGTADAATGLTDVGAREYDPTTGRFISVDPVFESGSAAQMGGYTYSGNDPISSSDPTGLFCWGFCSFGHTVGGWLRTGYVSADETAGNIAFGTAEFCFKDGSQTQNWLKKEHAAYNASDDAALSTGQQRVAHDMSNAEGIALFVDGGWNSFKLGGSLFRAGAEGFNTAPAAAAAASDPAAALTPDQALKNAIDDGRTKAGADYRHQHAAAAEEMGWQESLAKGEIGLIGPSKVNGPGPDWVTYDPTTGKIKVYDSNWSSKGDYKTFPDNKMGGPKGWMDKWVKPAVDSYSGPYAADIQQALVNNDVEGVVYTSDITVTLTTADSAPLPHGAGHSRDMAE
ncbi:RHS repeat domain-containing protein [Catenulispora rubra]|uniref:RHS repeat domain-containing protein n=1 Tax=Catenulispora rubra TaxID=280293 RepID=UPI00189273BF|nr:RHS repeat-associated core domain-containing protein [Catenulispora rubra]